MNILMNSNSPDGIGLMYGLNLAFSFCIVLRNLFLCEVGKLVYCMENWNHIYHKYSDRQALCLECMCQ